MTEDETAERPSRLLKKALAADLRP